MVDARAKERKAKAPALAPRGLGVLSLQNVVLRMRHQPEHDTRRIADSRNSAGGAVWIRSRVAKRDGVGLLERRKCLRAAREPALAMSDRTVNVLHQFPRPHRAGRHRLDSHPATVEQSGLVVAERNRARRQRNGQFRPKEEYSK